LRVIPSRGFKSRRLRQQRRAFFMTSARKPGVDGQLGVLSGYVAGAP
jgi:hypothetical protein